MEDRGSRKRHPRHLLSSILSSSFVERSLLRRGVLLLAVAEVLADGLLGRARDPVGVDFVGGFLVVRSVGLRQVDLALALLRRGLDQLAGEDLALLVHRAGRHVGQHVIRRFLDRALAAVADAGAAHALALLVGIALLPLAVGLAPLGLALAVLPVLAVVVALAVVARLTSLRGGGGLGVCLHLLERLLHLL